MITIRAVSASIADGSIPQKEYVRRMSAIQREAVLTRDMGVKTSAFWRMENLSAAFLKQSGVGNTLNDADLPLEIRPIAHCGMGIAAVEVANFEVGSLMRIVESFSNPDYRLFAYEGAGAMLSLYEPDLFAVASRGFSMIGLIPLARLERPDPRKFLQSFSLEIQRLIAHGYGRMLYFKSHGIGAAIRSALRAGDWLDAAACIQGIAFAYAMVNNDDLSRVLRAGDGISNDAVRNAFEDGLIYAMEFWEWMAPGFLPQLNVAGSGCEALIGAARQKTAASRTAGLMAAFTNRQQAGSV